MKERKSHLPQAASIAGVVRMPIPTPNVLQPPSSAERLKKLEPAANEK